MKHIALIIKSLLHNFLYHRVTLSRLTLHKMRFWLRSAKGNRRRSNKLLPMFRKSVMLPSSGTNSTTFQYLHHHRCENLKSRSNWAN